MKKAAGDLNIQHQRKEMVMGSNQQGDWNEGDVFTNGIHQHPGMPVVRPDVFAGSLLP
jgi:hypothetical protein